MTIKCACGCGQDLSDSEMVLNEDGKLETLRQDCIAIGRGESPDSELLERVWDSFVATLSDEDREELDKLNK